MMHRFSITPAARAICWAIPIGLIACADLADSVAPDSGPAAAVGTAGQTAAPLAAVQDAVTRLIPNLAETEETVALDTAFRELAAALVEPSGLPVGRAYAKARAALDHYSETLSTDDADVAAIQLALDAAR